MAKKENGSDVWSFSQRTADRWGSRNSRAIQMMVWGLESCQVGHDLGQVGVVGLLELVLDKNQAVVRWIPGRNVG